MVRRRLFRLYKAPGHRRMETQGLCRVRPGALGYDAFARSGLGS
jgi:hypothetical protein